MKQFLVIGLGRFGKSLAKTLYKNGKYVLGIDIDKNIIQEAINNDDLENGIIVDGSDPTELEKLGIQNFDVAFVCIGVAIQDSILVTLTLKELGIKKVVAKAITEQHGKVLKKIGADEIIYPEIYMGKKVALREIYPNMIEHLKLSPEYNVLEIDVPEKFINKKLSTLDLRNQYGINIIAIKHPDKTLTISPKADSILNKENRIIFVASKETMTKLDEIND